MTRPLIVPTTDRTRRGIAQASSRLRRRRLPEGLRTALLGLVLAVGMTLAAPPLEAAHAGSNSAQGYCLKAYNYADASSNYLFASTEATGGCQTVNVKIFNNGTIQGWDFEGSECFGSALEISGAYLYTSASASLDSSQWNSPCSHHAASYQFQPWDSWGGLWFDA